MKDDIIDLRDFAALACQWRQEAGLPSPIAHWKLDETTGMTASDERGQHPGILRNFPTGNSQWVVGASAGGLQLDGIDDYVEIGHLPDMPIDSPRTIAAWIKLNSIPTAGQTLLVWGRQPPAEHWRLEVDANRRLRFFCGAGYAVAARVVGDTQWHHIAVALDPLVSSRPRDQRHQALRRCAAAGRLRVERARGHRRTSWKTSESGPPTTWL